MRSSSPSSTSNGSFSLALISTPAKLSSIWESWLYVATVIEAHSRHVISWAIIDEHMRADLVDDTLKIAIALRDELPRKVIFHSDRSNYS